MPRRVLVGIVTKDGAPQTRRVEIERLVRHKKYSKIIRRKTVCHVHDEANESAIGDKVEIEESRPLSKLKRWKLIRVIEKSKDVDLATLKALRKQSDAGEELAVLASDAPVGGDGS